MDQANQPKPTWLRSIVTLLTLLGVALLMALFY